MFIAHYSQLPTVTRERKINKCTRVKCCVSLRNRARLRRFIEDEKTLRRLYACHSIYYHVARCKRCEENVTLPKSFGLATGKVALCYATTGAGNINRYFTL